VKWSQWVRKTGSAAPAKVGGHRTCTLEAHRDFLLAQLEAVSHLTLRRLKDLLAARGISVSHDTVWRSCGAKVGPSKRNRIRRWQHRPAAPTLAVGDPSSRTATPRLHRRDLDQDQHGCDPRLGHQR
jgi:hypothetical protein